MNPDEVVIDDDEFDGPSTGGAAPTNPDEVVIDEDDFDEAAVPTGGNPDEVVIDDDCDTPAPNAPLDESVDLVEAAFKHGGQAEAAQVKEAQGIAVDTKTEVVHLNNNVGQDGERRLTKFLALDKCGPGKDFIQVGRFLGRADCSVL